MNVVVFGATGKTGREVVKQALQAGLSVTAFARTPEKLTLEDPKLEVVRGDVLSQDDVNRAVRAQDAVVCALGDTQLRNTTVRSEGTRTIIEAMKRAGAERLLVVTSMGTNESWQQLGLTAKAFFSIAIKDVLKDHGKQENMVRESGLAWTIVRPSGLTDGPRTGQYQASDDLSLKAGRVARADVADLIVQALERSDFVGKAVAVTQ